MLLNCDSTFLYEVHVIVTTSHKHKNPRQFGGFYYIKSIITSLEAFNRS